MFVRTENRAFSRNCLIALACAIGLLLALPLVAEGAPASDLEEKTISYGDGYKSDNPSFVAGKASVKWGPALFENDPTVYDDDLAMVTAGLCAAAGDKDGETGYGRYIAEAYKSLGFPEDRITLYSYPHNVRVYGEKRTSTITSTEIPWSDYATVSDASIWPNSALPSVNLDITGTKWEGLSYNSDEYSWAKDENFAFSIASTQLTIEGKSSDVVVVTCRGTETPYEAIVADGIKSNEAFPFSKEAVQGFESFMGYHPFVNEVLIGLESYEKTHNVNPEEAYYLVCGHSLGGATANLVAGTLTSQGRNVRAYTFGALNSLNDNSTQVGNSAYDNIWNVFNYFDTFGPNGDGVMGIRPAGGGETWGNKLGQMKIVPFDFYGFFTSGNHEYDNHTMAGYYYAVSHDILENADFEDAAADRSIVLLLDNSGSMEGEPIEEVKTAAGKFAETVCTSDSRVSLIAFDSEPATPSPFTTNQDVIEHYAGKLDANGGTDIGAALELAGSELGDRSDAKKAIVLMTDGHPENGMGDDEIVDLADSLKSQGIQIYTLGFFDNASESEKISGQRLLSLVASQGCHYEIDDASDLQFFFGDIADQINGVKYNYIRIACPVNVTVECNGEVLTSEGTSKAVRASFGTLTFEREYDRTDSFKTRSETTDDDPVKVVRLRDGYDYVLNIQGTGEGSMDYSIGFVDDDGEYSDMRYFDSIRIGPRTKIDATANYTDVSRLDVDYDGDGTIDTRYAAGANEHAEIVNNAIAAWRALACLGILLALLEILHVWRRVKKSKESKGANEE